MSAGVYELGDAFALPPGSFQINLPSERVLRRTFRRAGRKVKRDGQAKIGLQMMRPLNEETGFVSVRIDDEDHRWVLAGLQAQLPAHLALADLELVHAGRANAGAFGDPV